MRIDLRNMRLASSESAGASYVRLLSIQGKGYVKRLSISPLNISENQDDVIVKIDGKIIKVNDGIISAIGNSGRGFFVMNDFQFLEKVEIFANKVQDRISYTANNALALKSCIFYILDE